MDRISTATKAPDLFGAGKHGFKDGNVAGGVVPTDLDAATFNGYQEEFMTIIEGAGVVPSAAVRTQVRDAIDIMIRRQAGAVCTAAGTADAITGAFTPAVTSLVNSSRVSVRAASANATTTPTFKADGTALKTIVKGNNLSLAIGDIAGAAHLLQLQYDLTLDRWVLLNPAVATAANDAAGADNSTRIATTGWSRLGFAASFAANGYIKLPNWLGGWVLQWGAATVTAGTLLVVTLPITFPTAAYMSLATVGASPPTASQFATSFISGMGTVSIALNTGTAGVQFLAIGK